MSYTDLSRKIKQDTRVDKIIDANQRTGMRLEEHDQRLESVESASRTTASRVDDLFAITAAARVDLNWFELKTTKTNDTLQGTIQESSRFKGVVDASLMGIEERLQSLSAGLAAIPPPVSLVDTHERIEELKVETGRALEYLLERLNEPKPRVWTREIAAVGVVFLGWLVWLSL